MKLFIDTTQKNFVCSLFDNQFNPIKYKIKETKFKVEEIINFFNSLPSMDEIKDFYINVGPGSFTGARIALIYIRTICQIQTKNIYSISTFELIDSNSSLNKIYINASKNKSYCLWENKIFVCDKNENEQEPNYLKIINNFLKYKNKFKKSSIKKIKPIYSSSPQIGTIKGNK